MRSWLLPSTEWKMVMKMGVRLRDHCRYQHVDRPVCVDGDADGPFSPENGIEIETMASGLRTDTPLDADNARLCRRNRDTCSR
jgi:hypothetical protein